MRVLLIGANGFIGSHIAGALIESGQEVIAAVRRPGEFLLRFPGARAIRADLKRDTTPDAWIGRLEGVDAVVNCAGTLQSRFGQRVEAVHLLAPQALFEACRRCGVNRIIHISAVSADTKAGTAYARTKAAAEEALRGTDLDWAILRPSLVYAAGSYGGTSLLRGLAALPKFVPVVGSGEQPFRPIHAMDLAAGIGRILERPDVRRVTLEPAGPEVITLAALLRKLRTWLGLRPARIVRVPVPLAQAMARVGDLFGATTFNSTALRQLEFGNAGNPEEFVRLTDISPTSMDDWLLRQPSHVQDRWHARLYWLRIALRYVLAAFWIASGAIGLWPARPTVLTLLAFAGLSQAGAYTLMVATCTLDIIVGLAIAVRWRPKLLGTIQLLIVAGYTAALGVLAPEMWIDPFGTLVKNVPILVAITIWITLENDR